MFLSAVILVLQEILEAALLISVLLALAAVPGALALETRPRGSWLLPALLAGLAGAWLYAAFTPAISRWLDYVGLEVTNALIQFAILACLLVFACTTPSQARARRRRLTGEICMVMVIALSITREVSEIILYLQGIAGQSGNLSPVLLGGLIATGIGLSTGVLLYYALASLRRGWAFRAGMGLLALFAGNMAAQAALLLTQADWLPYAPELWDTSSVLAEYSILGRLLYALVGYEANPSLSQAAAYLGAALLVALSPQFRRAWSGGFRGFR